MANSQATYKEVRFIIEPETLEVYIYIDCPDFHPAHGWKHKVFGKSMSAQRFFELWQTGKEDPLLWPNKSPDSEG